MNRTLPWLVTAAINDRLLRRAGILMTGVRLPSIANQQPANAAPNVDLCWRDDGLCEASSEFMAGQKNVN
jgi:hypothetical protein